ncbi:MULTISPECIES: alpha-amylase family glycosyl hydrolase [Halomonadaceae]|jgi:alpha-glucosidase|uniref:alpha-amylase family glycosyl hydrolase n=1 Tax=Halomonadaceae TaxID=28256 RepID=UPI0015828214|nr:MULTISPECIES: alpha-amylase family glycosyl hydrolase [Halomonas]MDI4638068.1 alpha-amylase family glycosyl hydrolase [Halomonas sp. BMC7]NUJ59070.1 alpha-glucosidase [Halomonas taeanensis]
MTLCQSRQDTRHDWWRGATLYQIYPRSFVDANGDGIGDLTGITSRLEHVASLNVDAIWLSPICTSPMDDFGYDVSDYRDVDPMFGTLDDFRALLERAHALGLKVIIDQVLSHSSDQHVWFQESRQDRTNPKADWYVWANPRPDGSAPNNWLAAFGGPAWTFDSRRCQYYLHNFLASQPDLNFHHPEVREAHLDNLRFWLELGVDGFRFDTANFYFHDRKLTDNPPSSDAYRRRGHPRSYQLLTHNTDQPENLTYLERIRALLDEYPGSTSVGEIGGSNPLPTMAAYTRGDTRLHMAYTFDLLDSTGEAAALYRVLSRFVEIGDDAWPCWALSNHDVARSASRWGEDRALLALTVLCSLRGSLCLYQGEELGLSEAELAYEDLQDPFGINLWPEVKGRDGCRTPMVWDESANGGFCPAGVAPWLPVFAPHRPLAVTRQDAAPDSLLAQVRGLLKRRGTSETLRQGDQRLIAPSELPEGVFGVIRTIGERHLLCLAHLGHGEAPAEIALDGLADGLQDTQPVDLPGMPTPTRQGSILQLMPGTAAWLAQH